MGGAAKGAASDPALVPDTSYYTEMLFRSDNPTAPPASPGAQQSNEEVGRILTRGLTSGSVLSPADRTYVANVSLPVPACRRIRPSGASIR